MVTQPLLAPITLAASRAAFLHHVAQGHRRQIVIPQALFVIVLLTALWLTIPHHNRPWLYRSRWLVAALVLFLSCEQAIYASSTNIAWAVMSGFTATQGSLLCFRHLIFTDPQRDAARVIKIRPRTSPSDNSAGAGAGTVAAKPTGKIASMSIAYPDTPNQDGGVQYVWQRFPTDAPFISRLAWALDLVLSLRGAGWSSSISVIPRPNNPRPIRDGQPICVTFIPSETNHGYKYMSSTSAFLWHRCTTLTMTLLMLDFFQTFMVKDPYFVLGPDKAVGYPLPSYLATLSPWRLNAYRQLFTISGVFAAFVSGFCLVDLAHFFITSTWAPSRCILWTYASAFGSLDQVLHRGLAGFWGSWWHQTFRQQFSGPAVYLISRGVLRKGSPTAAVVTLFSTFAMSGLLHASGSLSSMPDTKLWRQPAFFMLQAVGVLLQQVLASLTSMLLPRFSSPLRRAGNVAFTLLWLYATACPFNDDMAAMGVWLVEPVPFSVFRALGFGFPGDRAWRWDKHHLFRWHSGRNWWESGLTV